ncbi:condensation domain-containing protein [Nonomuraea longicatena]|uniref:Condensation domain-containing protein n=1 Tax=Nonomuraea longicatena TaxID=83682 RepID=A0ABP4AJU2_9ACTN
MRHMIPFRGRRSASAMLTWSQGQVWNDIQWMLPDRAFFDIWLAVPMPEGARLPHLTGQIAELVGRHESLRTLYTADRQLVLATGEVEVEVLTDVSDAAFDEALADWRGRGFDTAREVPIRFLVRYGTARPATVALCTSHLAADHASQRLLVAELRELVEAAVAGSPPPPRRPAQQPVDQAIRERSPAGEQVCDRAVEHWRRQLLAAPRSMFPVRHTMAGEWPRFWRGERISRAVPMALAVLASRYRSGPSSVLLAAVAALLGRSTGQRACTLRMVVDNRELPESRFMISTPTQESVATLALDQDSFAGLVRAAWRASVLAHRHGRCDPDRVEAVIDEVRRTRGDTLELNTFFNDTWSAFQPSATASPDPAAVRAAVADSRFRWTERYDRDNVDFFFTTYDLAESTELISMSLLVDTRTVTAEGAEEFLRRVEALLVALSADGADAKPSDLDPVAGFSTVEVAG